MKGDLNALLDERITIPLTAEQRMAILRVIKRFGLPYVERLLPLINARPLH